MHRVLDRVAQPRVLTALAAWTVVIFAAQIPPYIAWFFIDRASWEAVSILYIAVLSQLALVFGGLAWWQGGRVETRQEENGQ